MKEDVWYCAEVDEIIIYVATDRAIYRMEDGTLIGHLIPIETDFEAMGWTYLGEL